MKLYTCDPIFKMSSVGTNGTTSFHGNYFQKTGGKKSRIITVLDVFSRACHFT